MRNEIIKRFAAGTCLICMLYALLYSAIKGIKNTKAEGTPTAAQIQSVPISDPTASDDEGTQETQLSDQSRDESEDKKTAGAASQTDSSQTVSSGSDAAGSSPPTLHQFLSKLRCSGCRHNCLLVNPRCMNGRSKARTATTEYYELYSD